MWDHEPCAVLFPSVSGRSKKGRGTTGLEGLFSITYLAGDADLLRALGHLD